jgi:hypothetical protein
VSGASCSFASWCRGGAIATIARLVYNEPYRRVPMACGVEPLPGSDGIRVWHRFGAGSSLRMDGSATATVPVAGSPGHWLTDHSLGLGRQRDGRTAVYIVTHPTWALREVSAVALDVDFAAVYGREWTWLEDATPSHLSLATGSAVRVSRPSGG